MSEMPSEVQALLDQQASNIEEIKEAVRALMEKVERLEAQVSGLEGLG